MPRILTLCHTFCEILPDPRVTGCLQLLLMHFFLFDIDDFKGSVIYSKTCFKICFLILISIIKRHSLTLMILQLLIGSLYDEKSNVIELNISLLVAKLSTNRENRGHLL